MQLKRPAPFLARGFGGMAAVAVLVCLATGACVPPAPQPTAPPPAPPPAAPAPAPVAPPPAVTETPAPTDQNWMDASQTPGDWRYRSAGATTRASFSEAAGTPLFEMVCERGGQVLLLRQGTGGAGGGAMRILTETAERSLPATAREGAMAAQLGARDPLLDAMALSKGRFGVEVAGLPTLYLPAWPEVTRVVEDCR